MPSLYMRGEQYSLFMVCVVLTLDLRYLYRPGFLLDANFRLKNRLNVNSLRDVSLVGGGAYFVDPEAYEKHLLSSISQDEVCAHRVIEPIP